MLIFIKENFLEKMKRKSRYFLLIFFILFCIFLYFYLKNKNGKEIFQKVKSKIENEFTEKIENPSIPEEKKMLRTLITKRQIFSPIETHHLLDGSNLPITVIKGFESIGEKECRRVLQNFYSISFPRLNPKFLINPETGKTLQLDCYNSELRVACEYDGIQHLEYPNPFHKNEKEFEDLKKRDRLKSRLCRDNGVWLIRVRNLKKYEIEKYILRNLPPADHFLYPKKF